MEKAYLKRKIKYSDNLLFPVILLYQVQSSSSSFICGEAFGHPTNLHVPMQVFMTTDELELNSLSRDTMKCCCVEQIRYQVFPRPELVFRVQILCPCGLRSRGSVGYSPFSSAVFTFLKPHDYSHPSSLNVSARGP